MNLQFVQKKKKILFTHSIIYLIKYIHIELEDWGDYSKFLKLSIVAAMT